MAIQYKTADNKLFADALFALGKTFRNKGILDSATYYLFETLEIYTQLSNIDNIIKTNISIGELYRTNYELEKANFFLSNQYFQTETGFDFYFNDNYQQLF